MALHRSIFAPPLAWTDFVRFCYASSVNGLINHTSKNIKLDIGEQWWGEGNRNSNPSHLRLGTSQGDKRKSHSTPTNPFFHCSWKELWAPLELSAHHLLATSQLPSLWKTEVKDVSTCSKVTAYSYILAQKQSQILGIAWARWTGLGYGLERQINWIPYESWLWIGGDDQILGMSLLMSGRK